MQVTVDHVEWWTAKLRTCDRADVKMFYLGGMRAPDDVGTPVDCEGWLGVAPSASNATHSTDACVASPDSALWTLPRLLWAARLVMCDERTLWECIGSRFHDVFDTRVDAWNEQLAVKLAHYFLDAFPQDDAHEPPLSAQLASYASATIAPQAADRTACGDLQAKLDKLAGAPSQTDTEVHTGDTADGATPMSVESILSRAAATVVPMEADNDHSEGCLACRRVVPAFGELLRVPRTAMFYRESVLEFCPLAQAMQRQPALFESILSNEEALLVLSLVFEQFVLGVEKSHWAALLRGCPSSYPTVPAFWDITDLASLEGTDVLDDVVNKKTELQSFHEQVVSALPVIHEALLQEERHVDKLVRDLEPISLAELTDCFSYEALLWARATFDSRAFKLNIDGDVRLSLVPVADMINHDNNTDVLTRRVEERAAGGDFVMQVGAAVSEACVQTRRELWMSYGPLQNWELLQFYGFVLPDNEHDKLPFPFSVTVLPSSVTTTATSLGQELTLEAMETEEDQLRWWQQRRQRLMDRYSLFMANRCWLRASGVPSESLLALLRVHLAQADEFPTMEANSPFCPLSPATEASVVDTVRATVECVLDQFSTTLEEDACELNELLGLNDEAASQKARASPSDKATTNTSGGDSEEEEALDPHAWDNDILCLRLRLGLKRIAQRTLKWCADHAVNETPAH